MQRQQLSQRLPAVVSALVDDITASPSTGRLGDVLLPSRDKVIAILDGLQQLVFPGYFGLQGVNAQTLPFRVGRFVLMSSRDSVGGGPYIVEEVWPLSGSDSRASSRLASASDASRIMR